MLGEGKEEEEEEEGSVTAPPHTAASCCRAGDSPVEPGRPPRPPGPPSPMSQGPSPVLELPPSHSLPGRAAALAAAFIAWHRGTPGRGPALRALRRARRQDIDGVGHKYHLEFVLEDIFEKDSTVNCTAEVLYHLGNKNAAPDVQFTIEGELKNTDEADNLFYNRIKSLKNELVAENIPDSYGNVPPEMEPIRALAWAASGYVIWKNSNENTKYQLAQIKHVKQVKRSDEYLEFDYMILLHENVSQEIIPWQMTVLWHPQHGIEVTQNSRQPKHV